MFLYVFPARQGGGKFFSKLVSGSCSVSLAAGRSKESLVDDGDYSYLVYTVYTCIYLYMPML